MSAASPALRTEMSALHRRVTVFAVVAPFAAFALAVALHRLSPVWAALGFALPFAAGLAIGFGNGDESRNNWLVGIVALGEGWHHNHHALPTSARHGLGRLQLDPSWWIIRALEKLHLARNVRTPSAARVAEKLRPAAPAR